MEEAHRGAFHILTHFSNFIRVSFLNYEASTFSQQQKKILRCRPARRCGNVVQNRFSVNFTAAEMP